MAKAEKCFRLSETTQCLLDMASQETGWPKSTIMEFCVEGLMVSAVPQDAGNDARQKAQEVAKALVGAKERLSRKDANAARANSRSHRLRPELAQLLTAIAGLDFFSESDVVDAAVEEQIAVVAAKLIETKEALRDQRTLAGLFKSLRQEGRKPRRDQWNIGAWKKSLPRKAQSSKAKPPLLSERASAPEPAPAAPEPRWTAQSEPVKLCFKDAARYLGISRRSLSRLVRRNQIGVEILGHNTRFIYICELDGYLERHRSQFHPPVRIPKTRMSAFDPCI
jgi:hypothetical protein